MKFNDKLRLRKFFANLHPLRWPGVAIRFMATAMLITAISAMSLFATIYLTASVLFDTGDIVALLTTVVEKQTGGKLEIDKAQFDIFTGLNLSNIRFFAPDPANPVGHVNGGPVLTLPLATIEALNINYDIPKILLGRISMNALQIVQPNLTVEDNDAITNFSGIIAYRTKNFPTPPETPVVEPPEDPKAEPFTIPTVAIQPKNVYLPLTIKLKDIGVKNIGLSYRKTEKKQLIQELKMQGLGLDIGASWHGRKSNFSLAVGSLKNNPISLYFLQKTPEKTDVFAVVTDFASRFYLDDFSQINFDLDIVTKKITTPFVNFTDFDIHSLLRTKLHDDFRGIQIEKLGLDITRAFSYTLQGDIALPTGNPDLIRINLDQFFQIDIAELMELAKPFISGIKADGKIVLENLKIEGEIEPKKLQDIASSRLPFVSAKISLEDLTVNAEKFHANLEPLNGTISVAVTPALIGTGSQADTMIDLQMEQFSTTQKSPLGEVSAAIQDLAANIILRAMYPALIIPIAKVNLEIPHIIVGGGKLAKVDVPLLLDLDADAAADLSKIGTDLNLEIGNLMALKASLDCRNSCEKFRAGTTLSLESLEALHAIAYPIATLVGAGGVMPTALTGSVDMQFDAKGTLPNPLKSTPAVILKEGNVRFNTQVTLNDVSTKMALNKLELTELDTRFSLGGTLDSQKMNFRTGFKGLSLEAPGSTTAKPLPIKIGRFDYDLSIKNQFLEKIDLSNPIANLKTGVAMGLHIGEIDAPGTLPEPVKGVNVEFLANQAKLQSIEISKLELRVPDFGVTANLGVKAGLDPDFFPNQLLTTVSLDIDHGGGKDILGLLRTAGKLGVEARVETKDMKTLTLGGKTEFKNFHVTVNGKTPADPKVLVADGIDGKFPIKQVLDISEMIAALRAPPVAQVADTGKAASPSNIVAKPLAETMAAFFRKTEDRIAKTSNRVALVDYENVRPFYPEKSPIKIKRIEVANLELSDLEFDAEVRQNIVALNQFVINFLGGKIQGDFQFSLDSSAKNPKDIPKAVKTSLHITRLNSHQLLERFPKLKGKEGSSLLGSNPFIDATVHLKYDIANSDIDGGIEITSIGKEQLKMILYYVDPDELNPTIGDIRTALNIGDVRLVSIPIKNGEIGMEVDVRLLGAPLPVPKLSKVPISQIVRNITGGGTEDEKKKNNTKDFEEFTDEADLPKL